MVCGTSVTPACGAEAHDPEKWVSEKHALGLDPGDPAQTKSPSATAIYRAVALASSSAGAVTVRKAARQGQPHPRAAGAGVKLELHTAACGAVLHITQAARRFMTGSRGCAVRCQRKSLAIVFHGDAAISKTRCVGERLDADRDAAAVGDPSFLWLRHIHTTPVPRRPPPAALSYEQPG